MKFYQLTKISQLSLNEIKCMGLIERYDTCLPCLPCLLQTLLYIEKKKVNVRKNPPTNQDIYQNLNLCSINKMNKILSYLSNIKVI